jgi:hypothetical protein
VQTIPIGTVRLVFPDGATEGWLGMVGAGARSGDANACKRRCSSTRGNSWTALLALFVVALFLQQAGAQSLQTLLTNGPVSNRFNVVLLSEGYTSSQLGQFTTNASTAVSAMLGRAPFREYSNYFNAFAIAVASAQPGSDHPSYPSYKNTYFNSSFDMNDALPTIPPNSFDANYADGQGKVDDLLQTYMPNCHLPILLINDPEPGGSDGTSDKTAIVSTGGVWANILVHETGHVVAGLGDEYTNASSVTPIERPNTTRETNRTAVKWRAWIDSGTPVPTQPQGSYPRVIGLFEGANYQITGWYRPKFDCAMNHLGVTFCDVCSEALVLSIYQKVRPVDQFTPTNTAISVFSAQNLSFSLVLLQPSTHNLVVQWSTNGIAVAGATNSLLTLSPLSLGNGTHQVRAAVSDPTPLVRNDPTNLLSQMVTWTLNISLSQLSIDSAAWLPGGIFAFRVSGSAPAGFTVQGSTNLNNWLSISTNNLASGQFWYTNYGASAFPGKYFRVVTPPQ